MSASSGAAATGEGVVTALVSAAGAVLNSAAQAVSDGFRSLAANYGSGSEEEEAAAAAAAAAAALKIPSPIPPSSSEEEEEVTQSDERASKRRRH